MTKTNKQNCQHKVMSNVWFDIQLVTFWCSTTNKRNVWNHYRTAKKKKTEENWTEPKLKQFKNCCYAFFYGLFYNTMTTTENIPKRIAEWKQSSKKKKKKSSTLLRVQWNNLNKLPECKTNMNDSCMSNHWMSAASLSFSALTQHRCRHHHHHYHQHEYNSCHYWIFLESCQYGIIIFFRFFFFLFDCVPTLWRFICHHVAAHLSSATIFVANYWSFTEINYNLPRLKRIICRFYKQHNEMIFVLLKATGSREKNTSSFSWLSIQSIQPFLYLFLLYVCMCVFMHPSIHPSIQTFSHPSI